MSNSMETETTVSHFLEPCDQHVACRCRARESEVTVSGKYRWRVVGRRSSLTFLVVVHRFDSPLEQNHYWKSLHHPSAPL